MTDSVDRSCHSTSAPPPSGSSSHPPDADLSLTERIDGALPQTQCTRCGYPDCHAYAKAIAAGEAAINQCPPGGAEGVQRLATITGLPALPLNPTNGAEAPRRVAAIDETWCIGCTLCIQACPVDAIAGAPKRMHTVIADWCTGCELCLPPCPMDCIKLDSLSEPGVAARTGWSAWSQAQADAARQRYTAHKARLAHTIHEEEQHLRAMPRDGSAALATAPDLAGAKAQHKASFIAAAIERARQRQNLRKA